MSYHKLFRHCAGVAAVLLLSSLSLAAQTDSLPAFNLLRTPVSPAFTVLGVAPTEVERPNTPATLAVDVLQVAGNAYSSGLPQNFALEFSPYWLFDRSRLTWQQDAQRNILQSIERTWTLSVATAQVSPDSLQPVTGLALGTRFSLVSGELDAGAQATLRSMDSLLAVQASLFRTLLNQYGWNALQDSLARGLFGNGPAADSIFKLRQRAIINRAQQDTAAMGALTRSQANTALQKLSVTRNGFFLELAGAGMWAFPGGAWGHGGIPQKASVWLTPSYQWQDFSVVGVARYTGLIQDTAYNTVDYGARLIYTSGSFALSIEALGRSFVGSGSGTGSRDTEYRIVGGADFLLPGSENLWGVVSFGKNYDSASPGSLISHFGIKFNISPDRYTLPPGS